MQNCCVTAIKTVLVLLWDPVGKGICLGTLLSVKGRWQRRWRELPSDQVPDKCQVRFAVGGGGCRVDESQAGKHQVHRPFEVIEGQGFEIKSVYLSFLISSESSSFYQSLTVGSPKAPSLGLLPWSASQKSGVAFLKYIICLWWSLGFYL